MKDFNLEINIDTYLPIYGGLGGPSSDVVAILFILNIYLDLGLNKYELLDLVNDLGEDLTFFILEKKMLLCHIHIHLNFLKFKIII